MVAIRRIPEPRDPYIHEAGHVIVGAALGLPMGKATVNPVDGSGSVEWGDVPPPTQKLYEIDPAALHAAAIQFVASFCAGGLAEVLASGRKPTDRIAFLHTEEERRARLFMTAANLDHERGLADGAALAWRILRKPEMWTLVIEEAERLRTEFPPIQAEQEA
jgi:hypothetical protein